MTQACTATVWPGCVQLARRLDWLDSGFSRQLFNNQFFAMLGWRDIINVIAETIDSYHKYLDVVCVPIFILLFIILTVVTCLTAEDTSCLAPEFPITTRQITFP